MVQARKETPNVCKHKVGNYTNIANFGVCNKFNYQTFDHYLSLISKIEENNSIKVVTYWDVIQVFRKLPITQRCHFCQLFIPFLESRISLVENLLIVLCEGNWYVKISKGKWNLSWNTKMPDLPILPTLCNYWKTILCVCAQRLSVQKFQNDWTKGLNVIASARHTN